MVTANSIIDINPHGEMVKSPLINGNMVKPQEIYYSQKN